jgi:hypothetical protein
MISWAAMAHRSLARRGDAWIFSTTGARDRLYLRYHHMWILSKATRGLGEDEVMAAFDIADVERFVTCLLGFEMRTDRGLPIIYEAREPARHNPAWVMNDIGGGNWRLLDAFQRLRALVHGRRATSFSWVGDVPLVDIRASYLDPTGAPAFPGCWVGSPLDRPSSFEPTPDELRFMANPAAGLDAIGHECEEFLYVQMNKKPSSFESRSLPVEAMSDDLREYDLTGRFPKGWHLETATVAPDFGRPGGAKQFSIFDETGMRLPITELLLDGVVRQRG